MSTARRLPIAERQILLHMVRADGGWLAEDSLDVDPSTLVSTLLALEQRGWVTIEWLNHQVVAATLTTLGIAGCRWGAASVHTAA